MKTLTKLWIGIITAVLAIVVLVVVAPQFYKSQQAASLAGDLGGLVAVRGRPPACPVPPKPVYINRGDLIQMLAGALDWPLVTSSEQHFSDVPPSHPQFIYIETAYEQGVAVPVGTSFRPSDAVTRAEFAKIVSATIESPPPALTVNGAPYFSDAPEGTWFEPYVRHLYSVGVIRVQYRPTELVERAFAEEVMANLDALTP